MDDNAYLIGRQPILNAQEKIVAFELLFRSRKSISSAMFDCPTQASAQVMFNTISSVGIETLLGSHRGFINVDSELLMNDVIELLPPQQIGLELLESVEITGDVIERCRVLKALGYKLALDDHVYDQSFEPLYDGLVDIIKIDLYATPLTTLAEVIEKFGRFPVKLLAEKVDTRDDFLHCSSKGIELFQGHFLARPTLIQKKRLANTATCFLKLMQLLQDDAEVGELETSFKENPALVHKLLVLVNSVSYATREKIRTIRHALCLIGRQQLKRWVQIALFSEDGQQGFDNPIMHMVVTRASFMEELARVLPCPGSCSPDEAFLTGTLSMLIDVFDISMEEVNAGLGLSQGIRKALTENKGELGVLLSIAKLVEKGELDTVVDCFAELGIPLSATLECQKKAFNWQASLAM